MKTIFKLASVILALTLITASSNSFARKFPGQAQGQINEGITYVVKIINPISADLCHAYAVVIKDEYGNTVGSSIIYREGISTYVFHESGTVLGTRIASLEQMGGNSGMTCHQVLYADPDALSGKFRNGSVYIFNLSLSLKQLYNN